MFNFQPKVDFFLKGRPLLHGQNGVEIRQGDGLFRVTIPNCQMDTHDGEVLARASNEHGQAESRARLTVEPEEEESRSAPTFIKDLEDQVGTNIFGPINSSCGSIVIKTSTLLLPPFPIKYRTFHFPCSMGPICPM